MVQDKIQSLHKNIVSVALHLIKHCILMRSVLSADKTPHTNKEEVYRYKVTARDILLIINEFLKN